VLARLVKHPWQWPWSSAAAHVAGKDDRLVTVRPLLARVPGWRRFVAQEEAEEEVDLLRRHTRTGRPLGDIKFVLRLEGLLDRRLVPGKPGRPPKKRKPCVPT
jgi:putative transposase